MQVNFIQKSLTVKISYWGESFLCASHVNDPFTLISVGFLGENSLNIADIGIFFATKNLYSKQ